MTGPNDYIPDWTEQDGPYEIEHPDEERPEEDEDLHRDR